MHRFLLIAATLGLCSCFADTNLPLGLPADQLLPTTLDGYQLVSLDRHKTIVFQTPTGRIPVEIPLFVYLPERDYEEELRLGLKAIHEDLARMASSREKVEPGRLMTLFLALDRLMEQQEKIKRSKGSKSALPSPNKDDSQSGTGTNTTSEEQDPASILEQAIITQK